MTTPTPPPGNGGNSTSGEVLQLIEDHRMALARALLRSTDLSWPQLIKTARATHQLNGTLWRQIEAVRSSDGSSPDPELQELRQQVSAALTAGYHTAQVTDAALAPDRDAFPCPGQIDGPWAELVTAVMPIVVRLTAQRDGAVLARDRARLQVRRAYDLAKSWRTGSYVHGMTAAGDALANVLNNAAGGSTDQPEAAPAAEESSIAASAPGGVLPDAAGAGTANHDQVLFHQLASAIELVLADVQARTTREWAEAAAAAVIPLAGGSALTRAETTADRAPLDAIEVREPCPFCPGAPMMPRQNLRRHIDFAHPAVLEARRAGLLDIFVTAAVREAAEQREKEASAW